MDEGIEKLKRRLEFARDMLANIRLRSECHLRLIDDLHQLHQIEAWAVEKSRLDNLEDALVLLTQRLQSRIDGAISATRWVESVVLDRDELSE